MSLMVYWCQFKLIWDRSLENQQLAVFTERLILLMSTFSEHQYNVLDVVLVQQYCNVNISAALILLLT